MKTIPFTRKQLEALAAEFPTPFYIYDEKAIRENARALYSHFKWVPGGFMNYFAVKALPNPHILRILTEEGMGADCSSLPELMLAEQTGLPGEKIMFTSNDTPAAEFFKAKELDAIINLDDISHIDFLAGCAGLPDLICCRFNPGRAKKGNAIIGSPEDAKYGFTFDQLIDGYKKLKDMGVRRFGLHTMVASNELNPDYFIETAVVMFRALAEIFRRTGIQFEFVNLGGGIGIPYKPEDQAVDMAYVAKGIREAYEQYIIGSGHPPLRIVMECGRMITGPCGYLVSKVIHKKETYKTYFGLDSCMANLMRPGMYGAYHHITIPGRENAPLTVTADVTGSLCENNDKFAVDRRLPEIQIGDFAVIHDAGAHGHAMGFNYNGKLRSAEFLMRENGTFTMIRRAETPEDYFATLQF
ncbi:MAG: diaminopimelate decarboxylase [Spirochaetales bacterium]|nr:diaminopimelate decarboxylase [Spirochaetales bacterium]